MFWKQIGPRQLEADATTLSDYGIRLLVYLVAVTLLLALWRDSWATLLTAISISTLAVVLGLQDLLKSLLGGMFVVLDQPYTVGDHILLDAADGEVMEVRLRTTIIRSSDGHQISVPNVVVLTTALHDFDRTLESDTVVRLSGIRGDRDQTRAQLDTILNQEPAIAAGIVVSGAAPPRARTLFSS
jgi:small-conductance mechanosensitive channel